MIHTNIIINISRKCSKNSVVVDIFHPNKIKTTSPTNSRESHHSSALLVIHQEEDGRTLML
jgi:hypothetical protein